MVEIKSGIDISGVKEQLKKRINLLNECIFNQGEKPKFFIGLINLDSNKIENLTKYSGTEFNFNDNTLIICCIDSEYCGIYLSYEVSNDYLLHKDLKNLEAKIDNTKKDLESKIEGLDAKVGGLDAKIDNT